MDVINAAYTLQCDPILEPENVFPAFAWTKYTVQSCYESVVDKIFDQGSGVVGDITSSRISLDGCLDPDTDMDDAFVQSIWPVILQDPKVILVLERYGVTELKSGWFTRSRRGQRGPM